MWTKKKTTYWAFSKASDDGDGPLIRLPTTDCLAHSPFGNTKSWLTVRTDHLENPIAVPRSASANNILTLYFLVGCNATGESTTKTF